MSTSTTENQGQPSKLVLKKETLRQLTPSELKLVAGGGGACSRYESGCHSC